MHKISAAALAETSQTTSHCPKPFADANLEHNFALQSSCDASHTCFKTLAARHA
jgi:hypothetical protein